MSKIPFRGVFARVLLMGLLMSNALSFAEDASEPVLKLAELQVTDTRRLSDPTRSPHATSGITIEEATVRTNVVDSEDTLKYLPSVFLRKRNYGDTQPTLGTRVWGTSSSARSLVYADGVVLTALIANNNSLGAPRWGMVSPSEIERIDVLHGPFSAAY